MPGARALRVAFVWNGTVQDERLVSLGEPVVVGDGAGAIFPLPEGTLGDETSLTLMNGGDGGHQLRLVMPLGGDVWVKGRRSRVDDLKRVTGVVELGPDDFGVVTVGTVAYFFQYVRSAPKLSAWRSKMDFAVLSCVLLSAFVHGAFGTIALMARREMPDDERMELSSELMARFTVTPPPEEVPPTPVEEDPDRNTPQEKQAPAKTTRRPEPDRRRPQPQQQHTSETVSALTKLLRSQPQGPTLNHVVASTQFARGSPTGASGLASLLSTLPGGTVNVGTPTGGAITTLGGSQATSGVQGLQRRSGPVRGRVSSIAALARTTGSGLSRAQILEVIARYQGRIQQCYERALNRNGALAGRMTFEWQVTQSGSVSGARQRDSTLGDNSVTTCIIGVIRGMRFPRPTGGSVDVAFPFLFRRAE